MRIRTRLVATHLLMLIILVVVMLAAIQLRHAVLDQFATAALQP